jgi:hypothetical protein
MRLQKERAENDAMIAAVRAEIEKNPFKPKNPLRWFSERQKETHVAGSMHRGEGSIESYTTVTALRIAVGYEGPIDIGERRITAKEVPNYWADQQVEEEARAATGIERSVSCGVCCCGMIACMTVVCLPCYCHWRTNVYEAERTQVLSAKIDEISAKRLADDIIALYKEADPLVAARVAAKTAPQSMVVVGASPIQMAAGGGGSVTLSMDQLQALLRQQQVVAPQMTGVVPSTSAQPMLMQYPAQPMQPYPQPVAPPLTAVPLASMNASAPRS